MYFVGYFTQEDFEEKFEEKIDKWLWAVHNQVINKKLILI